MNDESVPDAECPNRHSETAKAPVGFEQPDHAVLTGATALTASDVQLFRRAALDSRLGERRPDLEDTVGV